MVRRRGLDPPSAARDGRRARPRGPRAPGLVHRRWPGRRDLPRDQCRDRGRRAAQGVPRGRGDRGPGRTRRGQRRRRARRPAGGRPGRRDRHPRGSGHRLCARARVGGSQGPGGGARGRGRGPGADAIATLGSDAFVGDLAAVVRVPSLTGDEKPVLELLAERGEALGLRAELREYDLDSVRAHPDWPGEEAPRDGLWGLTLTRRGTGPRLALCGHVDVVDVGTEAWAHGPFSGDVADGRVHGRGSVDMKGGLVAALHGLAAAAPGREVVLHCVTSEEDGGQGCFAELERDSEYAACLITEPTGFETVCAQGGSLTVIGEVHGVAAHAAERLHGRSAIDAYLPVHQ
ncbi:MAG: M20/M25/M40 family metallo-hydrolase, partial [Actinobacteria bacterium]